MGTLLEVLDFFFLSGGVGVRDKGIRFSIGGEPNLLAMFFENLYLYLTPWKKSKTSHKVHKLYQFLPSYSFLPVSSLVLRPQCEPALNRVGDRDRTREKYNFVFSSDDLG